MSKHGHHVTMKKAKEILRHVTMKKAKEILRHGEVHGKSLTKSQKGFFGARAGGASKKR